MKFAFALPCNLNHIIMFRRTLKSFLLMMNLVGIVIGAVMIVCIVALEAVRLYLNLPFSFGFVDSLLKNLAIMGFFILALTFLGYVGVILEGIYGKWLSIIHTLLLSVIVAIQIYVMVILLLLSTDRKGFLGTIGDGLKLSRDGLQLARTGFNTIGLTSNDLLLNRRVNSILSKPSAESMTLDKGLFKNDSPTYGEKQNSNESQQQPLFLSSKIIKKKLSIFEDNPIAALHNLRNVDAIPENVFANVLDSATNDVIGAVKKYGPVKQIKGIHGFLNKGLSNIGGIVDKADSTLKEPKRYTKKNVKIAKELVSSASETATHNSNQAIGMIRSTFEKVNPIGKIMSAVKTVSKKVENNIGRYNKHVEMLKPILGVLTEPVVFASRSPLVMACFVIFIVIELLYIILIIMYLCTMELHSEEDKQGGSVS